MMKDNDDFGSDLLNPSVASEQELVESFVSYVDLLGFKNIMLKNETNLPDLFKTLRQAKNILGDVKPSTKVKMFTDNFVMVNQVVDSMNLHGFRYDRMIQLNIHLLKLSQFQLYLAIYGGFFVRGGFTIGNIYIDDDIVYGPALIEAYEIEKNDIYPRVTLTNETYEIVKKIYPLYENTFSIDDDGKCFVDYLSTWYLFEVELTGYYEEYFEVLKKIFLRHLFTLKDVINNHLIKYKDDVKIYEKYQWVVRYFNKFCSDKYSEIKELIIVDV